MRTCQRKYHTRIEELPLAKMVNGKYELSDPYDKKRYVTCRVYGEMSDGTKVWVDEHANQYTRSLLFGKFYFVAM